MPATTTVGAPVGAADMKMLITLSATAFVDVGCSETLAAYTMKKRSWRRKAQA